MRTGTTNGSLGCHSILFIRPLVKKPALGGKEQVKKGMQMAFRKCGGFSLIELLASLLIITVGILGVVSLQSASLKGNHSAYFRTQATFIASDIITRMTANPEGVDAGSYDNIDSASPPVDPFCITTGCLPTQLADQDIREWSQYFSNVLASANYRPTLPDASGTVTVASEVFEVTVVWTEQTSAGTGTQTLTVQSRL